VLFADLSGFTAYSEVHRADEVITMLNTYWGATVPIVAEREGGATRSRRSSSSPCHPEFPARAGCGC
jgi:hypothetical protein